MLFYPVKVCLRPKVLKICTGIAAAAAAKKRLTANMNHIAMDTTFFTDSSSLCPRNREDITTAPEPSPMQINRKNE